MTWKTQEDWDYLFDEFEHLVETMGEHPEHAALQLGYTNPDAIYTAYRRHGKTRRVPQPLREECAYRRNRQLENTQ